MARSEYQYNANDLLKHLGLQLSDTQKYCDTGVRFLMFGQARSGKTFLQKALILEWLFNHPGQWFRVWDHYPSEKYAYQVAGEIGTWLKRLNEDFKGRPEIKFSVKGSSVIIHRLTNKRVKKLKQGGGYAVT